MVPAQDAATPPRPEPVVLMRCGARLCSLPVACVAETLRPLPVEYLAGAPPFVQGAAVVRGMPVPVLDLAALLGSESPAASRGRFVLVRAGERSVALAVDAVLGVRAAPSGAASVPPLLAEARPEAVEALQHLDRELLFVLRAGGLAEAVS